MARKKRFKKLDRELTVADLRREMKRQKRYGKCGYLGFVENQDLTDELEGYFVHPLIPHMWDWVNGNNSMRELEREMGL